MFLPPSFCIYLFIFLLFIFASDAPLPLPPRGLFRCGLSSPILRACYSLSHRVVSSAGLGRTIRRLLSRESFQLCLFFLFSFAAAQCYNLLLRKSLIFDKIRAMFCNHSDGYQLTRELLPLRRKYDRKVVDENSLGAENNFFFFSCPIKFIWNR